MRFLDLKSLQVRLIFRVNEKQGLNVLYVGCFIFYGGICVNICVGEVRINSFGQLVLFLAVAMVDLSVNWPLHSIEIWLTLLGSAGNAANISD